MFPPAEQSPVAGCYSHACRMWPDGLQAHRAPVFRLETDTSAATQNDRLWFEKNRDRNFRLRAILPGEREDIGAPDDCDFVVVWRIKPDFRIRYPTVLLEPVFDCDELGLGVFKRALPPDLFAKYSRIARRDRRKRVQS